MYLFMIMILIILLISLILVFLNIFLSKKMLIDQEKNSSFECGFDNLNSSRLPFSIHFFMLAILFLIFDVEILFLIPMIISFNMLNFNENLYMSMFIFMILYLGLEFEKYEGSLKWLM